MPTARIETPLKQLMEAEGRSQSWLARQLGVKRQQVWMWANGIHVPEHGTRVRIAQELGRRTEDLWPDQELQAAA